jgi:NAD(P)H-dependent FMN reductase
MGGRSSAVPGAEDCASGTFDAEAFLEANPALNNAVVAPLSAALERLAAESTVAQNEGEVTMLSVASRSSGSEAPGSHWRLFSASMKVSVLPTMMRSPKD